MNIINPLRPKGDGWEGGGDVGQLIGSAFPTEQWFHADNLIGVLSAVEVAKDKDGIDRGPEYHVSISSQRITGKVSRCSLEEALWVLEQFGMDGWEEDNHVPNGKVRNFWRPVAEPLIGLECECKETETVVKEGDYEWRPIE